jgi:HSP20 family molecular chaperone IbpA
MAAEAALNYGLLEVKVPKKTPTREEKKHKIKIE